MRSLGGPDAEVYDFPELRKLILPPLRADLRLLDEYRPRSLTRLRAPFSAFGGDSDPTCPVESLTAWDDATRAGAEVRAYPGGHHYLRDCEARVVAAVAGTLVTAG